MQEYSKVHADFVKINENNLIEIENILCTMLEYLLLDVVCVSLLRSRKK